MRRFVLIILWGMLLSVGVILGPGVEAQERAVVLQAAVWDTREIPVCWGNLRDTPLERQGRQWTREAVQATWERHSQLRFTGWQACTAQSRGMRIRIADIVAIEHVHEEPMRDTTPPHIVVLASPVREVAGTVEQGFDTVPRQVTLTVQGQVLDASGVAEVLVNGQRAQVDTAGNFQAVVQLHDTRTLHIRATDTQGNRRDATFAILRYAP
jgi:hypothetical protein